MEQSIVMIPMYNPSSGTHAAIARVRFRDGHAQVETRWSGSGQDEPQSLYLLTDAGIRAVRNNRAPFSKERLIGIASMTHLGACACGGPVRGFEKEFERMLVLLRMRYHDKPAGAVAVTVKADEGRDPGALKTQARVEIIDTAAKRDNLRDMTRALETAARKAGEPVGEALKVSAPLYGHERLGDEAARGYDAAQAVQAGAFDKAPPSSDTEVFAASPAVYEDARDDSLSGGFDAAYDPSPLSRAASAQSDCAALDGADEAKGVAMGAAMDAYAVSSPLFGHEPEFERQYEPQNEPQSEPQSEPRFEAQREPIQSDGSWTKLSPSRHASAPDEISGQEPAVAVMSVQLGGHEAQANGDTPPFDDTQPVSYASASPSYTDDDEAAATPNSEALDRILERAQSMFPHDEGDDDEAAHSEGRPNSHGYKPPPSTKPPHPPGHKPHPPHPGPRPPIEPQPPSPGPRPPIKPQPPHPGPRPPIKPQPPSPGPRPPIKPQPPHPGPRPPVQPPCPAPPIQPLPFSIPQRTENPFPKQFPGSSWVRVQRLQGQGFYLEGRMKRDNELVVISAVPGEYNPVPPRHLQGFTRYIQTKSGGYWVRIKSE